MDNVDFTAVRGTEPVKVSEIEVGDLKIKIGVASGAKAAKELLERVKAGEEFTFIEIMGCPGGCVNGGGQPIQPTSVRQTIDIKAERAKALRPAGRSSGSGPAYDPGPQPGVRRCRRRPIACPGRGALRSIGTAAASPARPLHPALWGDP